MTELSETKKGVVSLIALALVFASMGIFARYLQTDFTLFQQMYLRVIVALILALVFFSPSLNFRKLREVSSKGWILLLVRTLLLNGAVALFTYALLTGKYSNVTFVASIPLLPLLGFIFLKEKLTATKVALILLGFAGVVLIAVPDFHHVLNLHSWGKPELYSLLSTVFFDVGYISRKWQGELLNNKEITTLMFLFGGFFLFLSSLLLGEALPSKELFTLTTTLVILLAAVFVVINLYLTNYGFERVGAVLAGNILTLETLFALAIGILVYNELPRVQELLGGALIIFSVYQMNRLPD